LRSPDDDDDDDDDELRINNYNDELRDCNMLSLIIFIMLLLRALQSAVQINNDGLEIIMN